MVDKRWDKPDSSRDTIVNVLKENSIFTIIDIGAGTEAWSVLMVQHASKVTAVEPNESMGSLLIEKKDTHKIDNIEIIKDSCPELNVDVHDYTFVSHSMYGCSDFKAFVKKNGSLYPENLFPADSGALCRIDHVENHPKNTGAAL